MANEKLSYPQNNLLNKNLRFYLTGAQPCPYLPNRRERKLFTTLDEIDGAELNEALTQAGFRRSQNIAYRPSCDMCSLCVSVRIPVKDFKFKSWNRILKANSDLIAETNFCEANEERYALLKKYIAARHFNGSMADMDAEDFISMIEDGTSSTRIIDFRDKNTNQLVACVLVDLLKDGISLVYSFFDTDFKAKSIGSYIILSQIMDMQNQDKDYVYLGYWIDGSEKMAYKKRFKPLEALGPTGWALLIS